MIHRHPAVEVPVAQVAVKAAALAWPVAQVVWLVVQAQAVAVAVAHLHLVNDLRISKNVIFNNKYIENHNVKYWFSASELVILPYKTASQSGIIPLSIKFEIPVVCSNINGLKEYVLDNQTGFLFERTVENLSEKINYALKINKKKIISNIIKHKKKLSWVNFSKELLKNQNE